MKVRTAQIGNKLFIMDGTNPLRYLDLKTNRVKQYPRKGTRAYKLLYKFKADKS